MDVARPDFARKKRRRRILWASGGLAVLAFVSLALMRLKPALPVIDRSSVWVDTVKRGSLLYEVQGSGTLVPEAVRWIAASSIGRVDRILLLPGVTVKPDTVLLELSNPELEQEAIETESALQTSQAELEKLKVQLESDRLTEKATVGLLKSDLSQAKLEAEADETLLKDGLVPSLTAKRSRSKADELEAQYALEQQRLEVGARSDESQLTAKRAEVEKFRKQYELKKRFVEALKVRAGMDGVLQRLGDEQPLQTGQSVALGANIARIADPSKLKAQIKVPEMQAKDIQPGQSASVDTRNGVIKGHVSRVDPGVQEGTVAVDITFDEALPKGVRPDLAVDGTITIDRLDNVLYVGRPVNSRAETEVKLFKLVGAGVEAAHVRVRLGRSSISGVEIKDGLQVDDRIILSDMNQWDGYDRIRLN
jgi:HlyD family secretion protein